MNRIFNYLCGMKLHYRVLGEGRPVLILHGLFGSGDNWQSFAKELSARGFQVVLADLRNHGQSPHSDEFSYQLMAEDIDELTKSFHWDKVVLIGHSLGGKAAMKYAFTHQQKVAGLIVVDISMRQYPVHHQSLIDVMKSLDFNAVKSRSEAQSVLSTQIKDEGVLQFLLKNLYWESDNRLGWRFNLKAIENNLDNVGEKIYPSSPYTGPAMFAKGQNSDYILYDDEREIYEHFNQVEVITVPDAGHWVHAENPRFLIDAVESFLKKVK